MSYKTKHLTLFLTVQVAQNNSRILPVAEKLLGFRWMPKTVTQNVAVGCFTDSTIDSAQKMSGGLEDKVIFKSGKFH